MSFDVLRQEHGNVKYVNVNPEKYLSPTMVVPTGKIFDSIIENNKLNKNNMQSVYDFVLLGIVVFLYLKNYFSLILDFEH